MLTPCDTWMQDAISTKCYWWSEWLSEHRERRWRRVERRVATEQTLTDRIVIHTIIMYAKCCCVTR